MSKSTSAPTLLPIQFRCISFSDSGQCKSSRSLSNRSAYAVMRKHPLPHRLPHDGKSADFALAVDDFFVGQHRAQFRAPVDRNLVHVRQPLAVDHVALLGFVQFMPQSLDAHLPADRVHPFLRRVEMNRPIRRDHQIPVLQFVDQMADRLGLAIRRIEIAVEQLQENPLRPAVIRSDRSCRFRGPSRSSVPASESAGESWRCSAPS